MSTQEAAALVVEEINARGHASWRLAGRLDGGFQSGAWRLESADGTPAVLKIALTADWAEQVLRAERAVAGVRAAGYPTPAWLATGRTETGIGYQIQQLAPGVTLEEVAIDSAVARELITVLELQAELDPDPDRSWSDFQIAELTTGLPALRHVVAEVGPAGRDLVVACDRLLPSTMSEIRFPRTDLVHGDFRPGNILFDHGQVSGVIDIEAIGSGTRIFDYATLLDHPQIDDDALVLLVESAVEIAGPAVLRACLAQVALDLARFVAARSLPAPPARSGPTSRSTPAERTVERDRLTDRIRLLEQRVALVDRLTAPQG